MGGGSDHISMSLAHSFHGMEAYKHENTACHEEGVMERRWKLDVSNPCSTIPVCCKPEILLDIKVDWEV